MLTLALALCLPPAADPLPVPADSLAVVQVRGLNHLRTQLAGLVAAVAPHKAAEVTAGLAVLLKPDGRDLFALDVTRRAYLAVLPEEGNGVTWAVWLPTADYARFRATVLTPGERSALRPGPAGEVTEFAGRPLHLIDRTAAGYAVATPSEPTARRLATNPQPLAADALGEAAGVFLGSDLGLFVNLSAVQARYGGLLAGTRLLLPATLTGGAFGLPKLDARQAGQVAAVADGLIQAVADGSGFAVGVNLGPSGVTVETALAVRPGTPTARVLAGERPHPHALLDALPGGQSAYAAGRFGVELARRLRTAFPEVATAGDDWYAEHGWAMAGSAPGPVLEVYRPAQPARWLSALHAAYDRAGPGTAVQNVPLKSKPALHRQAVALRGLAFDRLAMVFDLPAATAAIADDGLRQAAHTTVQALVGERAEQWLGADATHGLRVTAADWTAARDLLDGFLGDGLKATDDAAVRVIRRRLPAEASAVVLLDAAAVTCRVGNLVRGAVNELPAFPGLELPAFVPPPGRSPFLGLAVVTRPTGVHATLVLPADALKAAVATVKVD